MTNSCKNVVLQGYGRLRGSISYFLATRSSQMNAEAANSDSDSVYWTSSQKAKDDEGWRRM